MVKHYKLTVGENVIGAASQYDFLRYQKKHNILLFCDIEHAQYIRSGDKLYHSDWMAPITNYRIPCENAELTEIGENEYNALFLKEACK